MSIITGNISNFISACRSKDIDLTKAEYLQVFNLLPTSVVEIHLVRTHRISPHATPCEGFSHLHFMLTHAQIVEECSERLSEEQVDYLVETVERIFLKT